MAVQISSAELDVSDHDESLQHLHFNPGVNAALFNGRLSSFVIAGSNSYIRIPTLVETAPGILEGSGEFRIVDGAPGAADVFYDPDCAFTLEVEPSGDANNVRVTALKAGGVENKTKLPYILKTIGYNSLTNDLRVSLGSADAKGFAAMLAVAAWGKA